MQINIPDTQTGCISVQHKVVAGDTFYRIPRIPLQMPVIPNMYVFDRLWKGRQNFNGNSIIFDQIDVVRWSRIQRIGATHEGRSVAVPISIHFRHHSSELLHTSAFTVISSCPPMGCTRLVVNSVQDVSTDLKGRCRCYRCRSRCCFWCQRFYEFFNVYRMCYRSLHFCQGTFSISKHNFNDVATPQLQIHISNGQTLAFLV